MPTTAPKEASSLPKFDLSATVSSDDASAIKPVLKRFLGSSGAIEEIDDGFRIRAKLEGASARDLNRMLLNGLRRAEKKTRLRAEWSDGETVEKFFDYVPKGLRKIS